MYGVLIHTESDKICAFRHHKGQANHRGRSVHYRQLVYAPICAPVCAVFCAVYAVFYRRYPVFNIHQVKSDVEQIHKPQEISIRMNEEKMAARNRRWKEVSSVLGVLGFPRTEAGLAFTGI